MAVNTVLTVCLQVYVARFAEGTGLLCALSEGRDLRGFADE